MKDPRLYSRKLRYCREAAQNGGKRSEGTKSESKGLGEAHFVRNYDLLANYLYRSH